MRRGWGVGAFFGGGGGDLAEAAASAASMQFTAVGGGGGATRSDGTAVGVQNSLPKIGGGASCAPWIRHCCRLPGSMLL